jgi:hypothetical protein
MHVGEQHGIDRLGIDAGRGEVALNDAGGRQQIITGPGVDDRKPALRIDQEGIDAGSPRRPKRIAKQPMRGVEIDVAHHVKAAVEISVADCGDDDVSDLAMIDAGNLLGGLRDHGEGLWVRRWDQEGVDAIEDDVGLLDRHVVAGADFDVDGVRDDVGHFGQVGAIEAAADHERRTVEPGQLAVQT